MQIHTLADPTGDNSYYTDSFLQVLESHRNYLLDSSRCVLVTINAHLSDKHQGDLYGLLDELNIAKQYHLAIAILNGYQSPADLEADTENLLIPNTDVIDTLRRIHTARGSSM